MNRLTSKIVGGLALALAIFWAASAALSNSGSSSDEAIKRGRAVFEGAAGGGTGVGCAPCHGHFGMGDVEIGPNNRGAPEARIRKAMTTVDAMSFLKLTEEEIRDLVAFLDYLGKLYPIKIAIQDSGFEPKEVTVPANRGIQFIFDNKGSEDCDFSSKDAGIAEKKLQSGRVDDVIWTSPAKAATFTAKCAKRPNAILTIKITEGK